jgi:hypothetical protein
MELSVPETQRQIARSAWLPREASTVLPPRQIDGFAAPSVEQIGAPNTALRREPARAAMGATSGPL